MVIEHCSVCPRRCGVRRDYAGRGFCGMPAAPVVARAALHFGEEPCISGTNGSGTIFFSGCSLRCVFCQNRPISRENQGKPITVRRLADIFRELEAAGAHNINLVNPTHFVPAVLAALELYRPGIPIVYNSGGYEQPDTIRRLKGAVDVFLPDLKYVSGELSQRYSGAADYFERASEAIIAMADQTGSFRLDENGMAVSGTMVRHLVLPGHTRESMAVLDWLAGHVSGRVWVSLLFQYTPLGNLASCPSLQRRLTARECDKVYRHLLERGLTDGYVQERSSAGKEFIPDFDLTGV